jgi:hypothetical protein
VSLWQAARFWWRCSLVLSSTVSASGDGKSRAGTFRLLIFGKPASEELDLAEMLLSAMAHSSERFGTRVLERQQIVAASISQRSNHGLTGGLTAPENRFGVGGKTMNGTVQCP